MKNVDHFLRGKEEQKWDFTWDMESDVGVLNQGPVKVYIKGGRECKGNKDT